MILRAERAEPVTLRDVPVGMLSREMLARSLFRALPLGWGDDPLVPSVRSVPVVLVADPRRGRGTMAPLAWFLRARGVANVSRADLRAGEGQGLAELAGALALHVEQVLRTTGAPRCDIVAHDGGGLVAAWWRVHSGGDARIGRLVSIATPWRGTKNAIFSGGRFAREITWGSPRLDGLGVAASTSVWSPDDPSVVPSASAVAAEHASVRIDGGGHVELLVSARVWRAVAAALGAAEPATASVPA